jgi:DHA3 family multidrug efflux protein-like MFS transporter
LQITNPTFWLFIGVILLGAIVGNVRNIALSTIVTLLVPKDQRANANGLAGTVGGIGFIVTSVFSGLAIGMLGMGWVLVIAIVIMAVALVHIWFVAIPEEGVVHDPELAKKKVDLRGSVAAISAVPGLFALLLFSTFNNLIGGVYMALLDPYGLTLFSVEMWGILFGVAGTGFVVGGLIIAKWGLGKNPVKTLLGVVIAMGLIGALFTIREWPWLLAIGLWLYMVITPAIEAAEQTVIQRVVPYERQGRVFGFAQAFESAAAPITSFLIAPLAEFWIIPYVNSDAGQASLGWLLGAGEARGIALVFLFSGVLISVVAACA